MIGWCACPAGRRTSLATRAAPLGAGAQWAEDFSMHISTKTAGSAAATRRPSDLSQAQAARTAVALAVLSLGGWQSSAWAQTPEAALAGGGGDRRARHITD